MRLFAIIVVIGHLFIKAGALETHAQSTLTLKQALEQAKRNSPDYKRAKNILTNNYWEYRNHLSAYRPQLNLKGDLPDISRTIIPITQDDGSEIFQRRNLSHSFLDLTLTQNIGPTGGEFFASSQLARIDILGNEQSTSYLANPVIVGFRQPIFKFNPLKWNSRIVPLQYEESQKKFSEDLELIAVKTIELYFDQLLAQSNLDIYQKKLQNNDTIYKTSLERFKLGKITESELLQLELNLLNSKQDHAKAKLILEASDLKLKSYLGIEYDEKIFLKTPDILDDVSINYEKAIFWARKNRSTYISLRRKLIEAEKQVDEARKNRGWGMDVTISFGLTQSAGQLDQVYREPLDREGLRLSFQMPILDWGRSKAAIRMAIANQELVASNVENMEKEFEQEIYLLVKQWNIDKEQLNNAIKSDLIAHKKYEIAKERYLMGNISITDLNIAAQEKEQAKRRYLENMRTYWHVFYTLRSLTLYDFITEQSLVED